MMGLTIDALNKIAADLKQKDEDSTPEIFRGALAYICAPQQLGDWYDLFFPKGPPNFGDLFPQTFIHPGYGPQLDFSVHVGINMLVMPLTKDALAAVHDGSWTDVKKWAGQIKVLWISNDSKE